MEVKVNEVDMTVLIDNFKSRKEVNNYIHEFTIIFIKLN